MRIAGSIKAYIYMLAAVRELTFLLTASVFPQTYRHMGLDTACSSTLQYHVCYEIQLVPFEQ